MLSRQFRSITSTPLSKDNKEILQARNSLAENFCEIDDNSKQLDMIFPKKQGQDASGLDLDGDDNPGDNFDPMGIVPIGLRSKEDRDAG